MNVSMKIFVQTNKMLSHFVAGIVRIPALDKRTQDGGTEVPNCDAVDNWSFFYIRIGGFFDDFDDLTMILNASNVF